MMDRADVVIIGGGVTGLSTAYHLAEKGVEDVCILEKEYLGSGASRRNAGGIRAQFGQRHNIVLARESIRMWESLSEELDFNVLYDQGGYLFLVGSEAKLEDLRGWVDRQNSLGVPSEFLAPREIEERFSFIDVEAVVGGSFSKEDGNAHHDAVVWGFEKNCRDLGVGINQCTEVEEIEAERGGVVGVQTNRGYIKTHTVVKAAGAHSRELAAQLGVELPIEPFRREILVTEPLKHFFDTAVIALESGFYCRQTLRGEVLMGVADPEEGPSWSIRSSLKFLRLVARAATKLIPALGVASVMRQWAGLYDNTPDNTPILGPVEGVERFIQASGFSGHGFMLSPIVGRLLAEYVATGETSLDLEPFLLRRFEEEELLAEKMKA